MALDTHRDSRTWSARMIAPAFDAGQGTRGTYVTRDFTLASVPADATLHITAQGLYTVHINGTRVGDDHLTPGWTVYDDRLAYQSYPVAAHLRPGANTITIRLGDGWWRSQLMWAQAPSSTAGATPSPRWPKSPRADAVLLATDDTWQSGLTEITQNGIYWGESVDARLAAQSPVAGVKIVTRSRPASSRWKPPGSRPCPP